MDCVVGGTGVEEFDGVLHRSESERSVSERSDDVIATLPSLSGLTHISPQDA